MRKGLILAILVLALALAPSGAGLASLAFAQEPAKAVKLKDVPDDHWAASAVYDLVKLGVTKGYPDGTFRGNKPITRYETAIFLSKLAKAIGSEDIKADIKTLKDQIADMKKGKDEIKVSGNYEGSWKFGNIMATEGAPRGGVANYRLILAAEKELGVSSNVKINLDTMDYGYFNDGTNYLPGNGLLASELLDVESNLKLDLSELFWENPVDLKLTYGPGAKPHGSDPTRVFPSEVGVTYYRPDTGVLAATKLFGMDVSGGYYSVQGNTYEVTGKINTSWITGTLGYTFDRFVVLNSLRFDLSGDYISRGLFSSSDRSVKAKVGLSFPMGEKVKASTTVGVGRKSSQMMVAGALSLNDIWDTGTVVTVNAAKVGSEYIDSRFAGEQFDLAGYDNFIRPYENATVNFGGELTQAVSDRAKLVGKGDIRLSSDYKYDGPRARLTAQGGVSYNIAPNVNLDAAYRVHQDKGTGDTSDMAAFGLIYRF